MIKDFILNKLNGRIKRAKHIKTKHDDVLDFVTVIFTGENKGNKETNVFKLLAHDSVAEWYKITHYDDSMDAEARAETRKQYPIDNSFKEHYPQTFEIDGKKYGLKWDVYDGDVSEKF